MSEFAAVQQKLKLLAKHFHIQGRPFSVEGREWLVENLFIPWENTAFKLWPRNPDTLDPSLRGQIGMVVEWTPDLVQEYADFEAKRPGEGLRLVPIMVIVHNLPRGSGKTTGVAGCCVASLAKDEGMTVAFAASAMKQTKTLVTENYIEPIESSSQLAKLFSITGDKLTYPRKGSGKSSFLEFVETSYGSITGRRRNRIVIDEARDVEGRTFTALLPSLRARAQLRCPHGHKVETYVEDVVMTCPTCKEFLMPYIPKVVVSSTSGLIEGGERDWFMELVESLKAEPNGFSVLFCGDDVNPALAKVESEMMETVFGKVNSISTYLDIELNNVARRKGQDFLTKPEIKAIVDKRLTNQPSSEAYCVGFLDTSRVADLTSLVIVANDSDRDILPKAKPDSFRFIRLEHMKYWDPKNPLDCPTGVINRAEVEQYLSDVFFRFPNLIDVTIDIRGSLGWVIDMYTEVKAGKVDCLKPFKNRIKSMENLQGTERNIAWGKHEDRVKSKTLRIFEHARLLAEYEAVRKTITVDGQVEIRDRSRKIRHADLLEGLTQCIYRIHKYMVTPRANFGEANSNMKIQKTLREVFGSDDRYKVEDF